MGLVELIDVLAQDPDAALSWQPATPKQSIGNQFIDHRPAVAELGRGLHNGESRRYCPKHRLPSVRHDCSGRCRNRPFSRFLGRAVEEQPREIDGGF